MNANKFSGTGYVLLPPSSALPQLSLPIPAAPRWSTLPPENPTLSWRNLALFCTKISETQKTPSPPHLRVFFPPGSEQAVSDYTVTKGGPGRAGRGDTGAKVHRPRFSTAPHVFYVLLVQFVPVVQGYRAHLLIYRGKSLSDTIRGLLGLEPGAHRSILCQIQCIL